MARPLHAKLDDAVMGFAIETRPGPALAIRAGKNDRVPVFVDVAALAAKKGGDRAKFLKEEAGRASLSDRVGKALAAAKDAAGVIEALRPIVDEHGSPGGALSLPGAPLLQPTDERRRTGSHYTPRSLTAPIVEHSLEPAFARLGPDARPEDALDLKVCDPAMAQAPFSSRPAARSASGWSRRGRAGPTLGRKFPTTRTTICTRVAWWRSAASLASTRTHARSIWRSSRCGLRRSRAITNSPSSITR